MEQGELQNLVALKIENLRPKLLDLSRRNPLISTKLGGRSGATIRVVDELPDVMFYKLGNSQPMQLVPLPDIDADPRDEEAKAFKDALTNGRLTDETYLKALDEVDQDSEDYLDRVRAIERSLKDRVRAALGMPPRQKTADINLVQHAKNHHITPSYDLPIPEHEHVDGRHTDEKIQTLLLPKDLDRLINGISAKCRTWIQETGINVLHIAYGFLEWSEAGKKETAFAPLILASAEIEKRRTRNGVEYWLSATSDDPETNTVMAEKLRLDFNVTLPNFDGRSIEQYLALVEELAPKGIGWKVRRQVAIGVFPSARMAMYHDLATTDPRVTSSDIVQSLLAGSNSSESSPFADEYNVDEPEIEKAVPYTVLDADSSQFSTLVDIANGKNLAVEGPPGTGKSQTIVNAIANALAGGKKVLFVAEKLAALNVVRSRLEAVGLKEYLLPLQAERSAREQVLAAVRERLEMDTPPVVRGFENKLAQYKSVRSEIAGYITILKRPFRNSGFTVHELLGKCISVTGSLVGVPLDVQRQCNIPSSYLTADGLGRLQQLSAQVLQAHERLKGSADTWRATQLIHPNRFTIDEACDLALNASRAYSETARLRQNLPSFGISSSETEDVLQRLEVCLNAYAPLKDSVSPKFATELLKADIAERVTSFVERCAQCQAASSEIEGLLAVEPSDLAANAIKRIKEICDAHDIRTLDAAALQRWLGDWRLGIGSAKATISKISPLVQVEPSVTSWKLTDLSAAHRLVRGITPDTLSLRNPALAQPQGVATLKRLCREGRALAREREELGGKASLDSDVSIEELSECLTIVKASGTLSFMSSKFRKAKVLASAVTASGKYKKQDVLPTLEAVIAFRKRVSEFERYAIASRVFASGFRGLDTDFQVFEHLAEFYNTIGTAFGVPDKRPLRNFLRDAELEDLLLIPELTTGDDSLTYLALHELIAGWEVDYARLAEAARHLKTLLAIFRTPAAVDPRQLEQIANQLHKVLTLRRQLDNDQEMATLLGDMYAGWKSVTTNILALCDWAQHSKALSQIVTGIVLSSASQSAVASIRAVLAANANARSMADALCDIAKLPIDVVQAPGSDEQIAAFLATAAGDRDGLFAYGGFAGAVAEFEPAGALPLLHHLIRTASSLDQLGEQVSALAVTRLARLAYEEYGAKLSLYSGAKLDDLRRALARQDREIIELSRSQLRAQIHAHARPPRGNGAGKKSTWTEMALLENEASKQQRYIPVRDLTARAGRALLEMKPCWMMSPLAVAQFVPKGVLEFDLCIIDEASQMPPEAAIGSLLRCKRTVVVGDTNQLPPSSFFKSMLDDEESDEDDNILDESILAMANATFRPSRRLRWHYRSRHSGLINFSNRLVYDDNLVVFPSATEGTVRMGVKYKHVQGLYKTGTNPIEARAIVDAILEFMHADPDRSLGVVTLNQKQRDLIREELDNALTNDGRAVAYIESWKEKKEGLEEFFIKNLENVQGDERDVIFIGTVYGPEIPSAKVAQRFGPINRLAGKRRLNVLFSRAKEKIVTFSSMTAADILAEEGDNTGVYMLKRWLEYSATGVLESGKVTTRPPDSDFEVFVADQIRAMGYESVPQVGAAGYFIDIGVRHPGWEHGYIMGVECDGATYHSAKSARDRDRLRQEVLEGLGWRLHRIWSTDWFNNPHREIEKLRTAIVMRMEELRAREHEFSTPRPRSDNKYGATNVDNTDRDENIIRTLPGTSTMQKARVESAGVQIGDTVRVRYLDQDKKMLQVTITTQTSNTALGLIHFEAPIAQALLGAEEGDEVEILVGSYVRAAVVEKITRRANLRGENALAD
ncbi:MAG: DUF4011 domain-containing protein [Hyphomicrobiaceae bacterium]|nr:DUF4011 domain-containing protein [Hyphomicrobiaceae bacterium]MCC0009096.1 DUF4011 domain-containing protein [Hyphomicrobiaceae bacterium]